MAGASELRQAHADLLACYNDIRKEFADLDDRTMARFLGKYNSPQLRQQIREHGDGYTIRSVPSSAKEILLADVLVLIVMNSPKLDDNSVFRLHASLTDIPYWREDKRLQSERRSQNGDLLTFQFLVWEQVCPMHGEIDDRARANQRLLFQRRPRLRELIPEQEQKSEKLLSSCRDWLGSLDRRLVVLTNAAKKKFNPPIIQLLSDETVLHIPTKLFGVNRTIIDKIDSLVKTRFEEVPAILHI